MLTVFLIVFKYNMFVIVNWSNDGAGLTEIGLFYVEVFVLFDLIRWNMLDTLSQGSFLVKLIFHIISVLPVFVIYVNLNKPQI